jgi:uncharacterized protein
VIVTLLRLSEALQALYAGDADRARSLLRPDSELTIFEAAAFGRIDRLRSLLGSDPGGANHVSEDGFTALHLAVFGQEEEAVRVLIEHGADLDCVSSASLAQVTPLGTAAFVRSVPLARILLEDERALTAIDARLGECQKCSLRTAHPSSAPAGGQRGQVGRP